MPWFTPRSRTRRVRLHTEAGDAKDQYLQLPLSSSFDYLDVLSLQLAQKDLFQLRQANYGAVAGRVVANEGVGVPNCRVSIFIPAPPLNEEESGAEVLLRQRYPWQSVGADEVDAAGRRYNLLPNQASYHAHNGFPYNDLGIGATPVTPLGSFPEREAVLTDPVARAVYERYYRHTTVTNESGDFVLLGIPLGQHTLHLDADLTDLGRWSYSPAMLQQVLGFPESQFEEGGKRIKETTDLDSLSHLISLNATVNVRPLWAQTADSATPSRELIGITRQDFRFPAPLRPHFTLAGSIFSMGRNRWWGDNLYFRFHFGLRNLKITTSDWVLGDGCDFKIAFCARLDVNLLPTLEVSLPSGACDGHPDESFSFGLGFRIPNIIPFFRFEFRDDYCRLNGGKYDSSPLDVINHGRTCVANIEDALAKVPDEGLTSALQLGAHRTESAELKLFSLTDEISDEQAARWLAPLQAGADLFPNAANQVPDADWASFNPRTGVRRVSKSDYLEINEDGQFILQPFCNRKPMVTREDGQLVDSTDPKKGVMTEFRGYLYVKGTGELDTPTTADASARLALKVPQSFDYSYRFDSRGVPGPLDKNDEWIFQHGLFKAGGLYSIAQRIATRRATLNDAQEEANDTDFSSADDDGSVYKQGWDIQTGLILNVDTPADQLDRFPANDNTRLGFDGLYERTPDSLTAVSTNTSPGAGQGSGPVLRSFDATNFTAGLTNGINVRTPALNANIYQGGEMVIEWDFNASFTNADRRVSIELIIFDGPPVNANIPSANTLLLGNSNTLKMAVDLNYRTPLGSPLKRWTPFVVNQPTQVNWNGFRVQTAGLYFPVRFLIRSLADPNNFYGVSQNISYIFR